MSALTDLTAAARTKEGAKPGLPTSAERAATSPEGRADRIAAILKQNQIVLDLFPLYDSSFLTRLDSGELIMDPAVAELLRFLAHSGISLREIAEDVLKVMGEAKVWLAEAREGLNAENRLLSDKMAGFELLISQSSEGAIQKLLESSAKVLTAFEAARDASLEVAKGLNRKHLEEVEDHARAAKAMIDEERRQADEVCARMRAGSEAFKDAVNVAVGEAILRLTAATPAPSRVAGRFLWGFVGAVVAVLACYVASKLGFFR